MFIQYKMRYLVVSKKKIHNWCEGEKNIAHQIRIFVVFTHVSNICVSDRGKNEKNMRMII